MLSRSDVKHEAVNQLKFVVVENGNGVVDNVANRLIAMDNPIFKIETLALSQVTLSGKADSMPVFRMDVLIPEEMIC